MSAKIEQPRQFDLKFKKYYFPIAFLLSQTDNYYIFNDRVALHNGIQLDDKNKFWARKLKQLKKKRVRELLFGQQLHNHNL